MDETGFRNRNRGYQQLRVWQDSIAYYAEVSTIYRALPFDLRRVVTQQLASADSVHRNIAEGYARRSVREYIQHRYVALASLAECVSGNHACRNARQITPEQFTHLDSLAYKLENGPLKLVERLEQKRDEGDWTDHLIIKDSNSAYCSDSDNSPPS